MRYQSQLCHIVGRSAYYGLSCHEQSALYTKYHGLQTERGTQGTQGGEKPFGNFQVSSFCDGVALALCVRANAQEPLSGERSPEWMLFFGGEQDHLQNHLCTFLTTSQ